MTNERKDDMAIDVKRYIKQAENYGAVHCERQHAAIMLVAAIAEKVLLSPEAVVEPMAKYTDRQVGRLPDGVTWSDLHRALTVLLDEHTYRNDREGLVVAKQDVYGDTSLKAAWVVVRKTLGLPV